jgi:hypothetical protein
MKNLETGVKISFLVGLMALASGCIVAEPHDGYWDRDHHRYYRDHGWHDCAGHDEVCR